MPSILNNGSGPLSSSSIASAFSSSLLDAGRRIFRHVGIGMSDSARQLTASYLDAASSGGNTIFSAGASSSTDVLMIKIKALRASIPKSQLAVALQTADDNADNGKAAASSTVGTNVDTSA